MLAKATHDPEEGEQLLNRKLWTNPKLLTTLSLVSDWADMSIVHRTVGGWSTGAVCLHAGAKGSKEGLRLGVHPVSS